MFNFIKRLFPSYRLKQNIDNLRQQILLMEQRLNNLSNAENQKRDYLFWLLMQQPNEDLLDTRKRVLSSLPQATGELRKCQLANNYILKRIKRICDDHQLKLMLDFGTLLGSVRHHGFIPWDDDIDVMMLRPDYEKFVQLIKDDDELTLMTFYRDCYVSATCVPKVKFRESDYFFVDIWVYDIIPLCGTKTETWERTINMTEKYIDALQKQLLERFSLDYLQKHTISSPEIEKNMAAIRLDILNNNPWYSKTISTGVSTLGFDYAMLHRKQQYLQDYKLESTSSTQMLLYEGEYYTAPYGMEDKLRQLYNDYWSFPRNMVNQHFWEMGHPTEADLDLLNKKGIC